MKEFETLTKDVLQRERQYGRLLCEWKCKGNEENGEYKYIKSQIKNGKENLLRED